MNAAPVFLAPLNYIRNSNRSPVITLLLTSFDTWRADQPSNASDDLLEHLTDWAPEDGRLIFLRKLPVATDCATALVLAEIERSHPDGVLCCGMAEGRGILTVEDRATGQERSLHTSLDLENLTADLPRTEISFDAGNFVCNQLYFNVLKGLQERQLLIPCAFVHVPILTEENAALILEDMRGFVRGCVCSIRDASATKTDPSFPAAAQRSEPHPGS